MLKELSKMLFVNVIGKGIGEGVLLGTKYFLEADVAPEIQSGKITIGDD